VSRSWASREANAPGTRIFIADIFELCRERVKALFDQALDVIEDAMKARQFLVVNRVLVDVGPDHYAQLEAVKKITPENDSDEILTQILMFRFYLSRGPALEWGR
jgi:hypothetical protein